MCLAVPGKIISMEGGSELNLSGKVQFGGIVKEINLACVPEAKIGDYVIVHAGLAISQLDQDEANKVFEFLDEEGRLRDTEDRE